MTVTDKLAHLDELRAQVDTLHHDLKRSLAIQSIWPDAFDHGSCTSYVVGNPRNQLTFCLTMANNETREKPLEEVPTILWNPKLKADILMLGPVNARKYYRLLKGES
jgi:hypothetical protein